MMIYVSVVFIIGLAFSPLCRQKSRTSSIVSEPTTTTAVVDGAKLIQEEKEQQGAVCIH